MGQPEFSTPNGALSPWTDLTEILVPAADRLPVRISAAVPLSSYDRLTTHVVRKGNAYAHASKRLFIGWMKEFFDGGLGSRTALFHEEYADDPGNKGTQTVDATKMLHQMKARVAPM